MASLVDDAIEMAEDVARELRSFGYRLDFRPVSVLELERVFTDHTENGRPRQGGFFDEYYGPRVFALGAYLGEVIRRNAGGTWRPKEGEPDNEIELALQTANDYICWPIQRAMKRVQNGSEDDVVPYALHAGLSRDAVFNPRRWWHVWR